MPLLALAIAALVSPALAAPDALTVETWNVGLAHGFVDHADQRAPAIADAVASSGADVLCLQEVWTPADRARVAAVAQSAGWSFFATPVEQTRADAAPACARSDLFGDGRFVSCLTDQCADVSGDARTDCIVERCSGALGALRDANPTCATALMAQVGRSSAAALWAVRSPLRKAATFAYGGSDGLMLLSRAPLTHPRVIDLSDLSTLNRRRALVAELEASGGPVTVACTHLSADLSGTAPYPGSHGSWGAENAAQVEHLVAALADRPAVVLAGDVNCGLADDAAGLDAELPESCLAIEREGYADPLREVWPSCTWCPENTLVDTDGDARGALIDHIYTRGVTPMSGGRTQARQIEVRTPGGLAASHLSDHFGASVTVRAGAPPNLPDAPTLDEARAYVHRADAEVRFRWRAGQRAAWRYETDLTDDHEAALVAEESATMAWMSAHAPVAHAVRQVQGLDPLELRQLDRLTRATSLPAPADAALQGQLAAVSAKLSGMYGKGQHCADPADPATCRDLGELSAALAESDEWDTTLDAWASWRTVSPPMKPHYAELVTLGNQGARELGYADMGELWRAGYDMPPAAVAVEADRLWDQVRPLYEQLHCAARGRLAEKHGADRVPPDGLLPAHLTGNMWAQSWEGLYPLLEPHPGALTLDVSGALEAQSWDALRMAETAQDFFTSMGLDPMPETFWERSMFVQPEGREVVCHASAWDVELNDDQRIKMCIRPTLDDLITLHHELGHNYYTHYHTGLPILLQDGAHDGFHEAIGDAVALSITPSYLQQLGLVEAAEETPEAVLNKQMLDALQKVAFLPFGRMIDQWRWDVFSGAVPPEQWNEHWWTLRARYQGVGAPVERPPDAFDPGAKYHIPGNTPYLRYFFAAVLQFQLHQSMCEAAGHTGPLHTCSVYGSNEAGERLAALLALGASKPWPDALEAMTGSRQMDAGPMLEYFSPLQGWLERENQGRACGWTAP